MPARQYSHLVLLNRSTDRAIHSPFACQTIEHKFHKVTHIPLSQYYDISDKNSLRGIGMAYWVLVDEEDAEVAELPKRLGLLLKYLDGEGTLDLDVEALRLDLIEMEVEVVVAPDY